MVALPGRSLRPRRRAGSLPPTAGVSFVIAGDPGGGSHFNGKLDSPKVWGRALAERRARRAHRRRRAAGRRPRRALGLLRRHRRARRAERPCARHRGPRSLRRLRQPAGARHDRLELGLQRGVLPARAGACTARSTSTTTTSTTAAGRPTSRSRFRTTCAAASTPCASVQGEAEDRVPFFVIPPRGTATARIAFLVPTASYLAYANDHIVHDVPVAQSILGHTSVISEQDFYLYGNLDLGLSTYDSHSDGSGVCFSSSRRPIMNMRPDFRHATGSVWQFPADLHLVDWLDEKGYEYDVVTDLELHDEGRRPARPLPGRAHRLAPRVLLRAHAERLGAVPRRRRPGHVPGLERLLLGDVVASREAVDDRGAQVRAGLARVAGQAGRVLPRDQRRARRPLAHACARAAEAVRRRASRPRASIAAAATTRCPMPPTRAPRSSWRASSATR